MNFTAPEKRELLKAWSAVTIAFTILFTGLSSLFTFTTLNILLISATTAGLGFLLHEIAHKYLATRYHCRAEFHTNNRMLLFMILISFFGFIFAAPGAVSIQGRLTTAQHGRISLAGPATNILLSLLFLAIHAFTSGTIAAAATYGATINAWLGLFNMLPFWNLDGASVFTWNKPLAVTTLILAAFLTFAATSLRYY